MSRFHLWTLLTRSLKPYTGLLLVVLLLQILQILGTLVLPTLNARIVDDGVAQGDTATVVKFGSIMAAVALAQMIINVIAVLLGALVAMRAARDLRAHVFHQVMSFGGPEYAKFGVSTLITRNTNDIRQVQQFVVMGMTIFIMAPLMAIGGIIMALLQDLTLSWLVLVTVVVLSVVLGYLVVKMVPSFKVMQERLDRIGSVLSQQLTGLRVIRAFVKESTEEARYDQANRDLTAANLTVGHYFVILFPAVFGIVNLASAAVLWFGAFQVNAGSTEVGTLMAFVQYLMLILMGVMMVAFISMMIPRAEVSAARIDELLSQQPHAAPTGNIDTPPQHGAVAFTDVSFTYPGAAEAVVTHLSFSAEPGTTTAIIGATGAGKSTIVSLLTGLLQPDTGHISIGGVPMSQLSPAALAAQFGYVPQRPVVLARSVRENLLLGNPTASEATLTQALQIAQAAEFVNAYDDGLDHQILAGGANLSGGQRQRLAIAMAVARQAPILVFDDSFSALDTSTDKAVRNGLAQLTQTTQVIVTQRVSTAAGADQVIVLDKGRIIASGTHPELVHSSAVYREIVDSQMGVQEGQG